MYNGQSAYTVNCEHCNTCVAVVNPRVQEEPIKVWPTDFGLTLSDNIEIVRTRCPSCGGSVWAKFQYR
jgi:hypothetical protein